MHTMDLGRKPSETKADSTLSKELSNENSKVYYPTLYISDVDDISSLPDGSFTFTGKGKVVSKTESARNGKKSCSCEIEVHSITPSGKKEKTASESLDETLSDKDSAEYDPEEE